MDLFNECADQQTIQNSPKTVIDLYDKFLERVKSFDHLKWFGKPKYYSPIECAKHGWFNYDKDTLKCASCFNLFYVYTQKPHKFILNTPTLKEDVEYKKLIEKHNSNCPWRTVSVSDDMIDVDLIDIKKAIKLFKNYKASFDKANLPVLKSNIEYFNGLNDPLKQSLYTVAACGWSYNQNLDVIKCEKCFRSIALWLYKRETDENNEIKNVVDRIVTQVELDKGDTDSNKHILQRKRKYNEVQEDSEDDVKKMKLFDPINEHNVWCPWLKCVDTVKNLNACQLNIKLISENYDSLDQVNLTPKKRLKTEENISIDRIRNLHTLLNDCTSNRSLDS